MGLGRARFRFDISTNRLDVNDVFHSTLHLFLHEVGHAFGLCDTLPHLLRDQVNQTCDPVWQTEVFKNTLMSDSFFLSLTSDDREGITKLFESFRPLRGQPQRAEPMYNFFDSCLSLDIEVLAQRLKDQQILIM